MNRKIYYALISLAVAWGHPVFSTSGYVTPTKLTLTFTSASLIDTSNRQVSIFSTQVSHEFNRADADLTASSLGAISVAEGRYSGVNVCYLTNRSVTLDGVKYEGTAGGSLVDGSLIYSSGVNATTANSITTTVGTPSKLGNLIVGTGTSNCSTTTFAAPVCIAIISRQGSVCVTGDTKLDPTVIKPNLQLQLDMYHSVGVDATHMALDPNVASYPYATLGTVGAAVHLSAAPGSGVYGDIVLLFGSDKTLSYASASANGSLPGFCAGTGAVTASSAPSGKLNTYGPSWVMSIDSNGMTQFVSGNCSDPSHCTSSGMLTIANALQSVGNTTAVTCPIDSTATPPNLGFKYPSGPGVVGTTNFTISRIVDPNNVLGGLCTSSAAHYLPGSTPDGATGGTCATNAMGGGYP